MRRCGFDVRLPGREFRRVVFRGRDFRGGKLGRCCTEATTIGFEMNCGATGRETCALYTMA